MFSLHCPSEPHQQIWHHLDPGIAAAHFYAGGQPLSVRLITLETVRAFRDCPRAYAQGMAETGEQRFRDRCRSVLLSLLKSNRSAAAQSSPRAESARVASATVSLPHAADVVRYDIWYRNGDTAARADIVAEYGGGRTALALVRAGNGLRRSYLAEAAFILQVAAQCGQTFSSVFLYHPQKGYTRDERIDSTQLFACIDITTAVERTAEDVSRTVQRLRLLHAGDPEPGVAELRACGRTQICGFCRSVAPLLREDDPRTLFHGRKRGTELLGEGVVSLLDLPPSAKLSEKQSIQVNTVREQRPHIDPAALRQFLARLQYPLHFLDFEAFSAPLPPWSGTRVWEHIPYLYSVQTVPRAGASAVRHHFCARPDIDYRRQFVEELARDVATSGSVLVYGREFESRMLRRLADWVEDGAEAMMSICHRLVDLAEPFQRFWYYHHRQRGSLSLKTVLPLLTGIDYQDLEIRDGLQANLIFAEAVLGNGELNDTLRAALIAYCERDTGGMVAMAETLSRLCHEN